MPDTLASAFLGAMLDAELVDAAAERVGSSPIRAAIRPKVVALYERLAAASNATTNASTPA
jgi:hypothetical protein